MSKITLFQFPRLTSTPNFSPFCMKIENYLRMSDIPYQIKVVRDPRRAPKGKLPFITDGDKKIADSHMIVEYLQKKFPDHIDHHLMPEQKAEMEMISRYFSEYLYWILLYGNWIDPIGYAAMEPILFGDVPKFQRFFLRRFIAKYMQKSIFMQGIGRHKAEEIYHEGKKAIDNIAAFLGNKKFFMGDKPTSLDATAFAFLENTRRLPYNSPLKASVQQHLNLVEYCDRMNEYLAY